MPTYEYRCPEGHLQERVSRIADYTPTVCCNQCPQTATRFISRAPMGFVRGDVHYRCPITDEPITSLSQHEENLARHGCRLLEPGEQADAVKFRQREEAEFDAKIEATAEEFVGNLPPEKLEKLGIELDSGADVSIERI